MLERSEASLPGWVLRLFASLRSRIPILGIGTATLEDEKCQGRCRPVRIGALGDGTSGLCCEGGLRFLDSARKDIFIPVTVKKLRACLEDSTVNWRNDPNLSATSDRDYLSQLVLRLTEVIDANPEDQRTYFLRGNAYLDGGEYEAAIADYTRAVGLDSGDAVAYNNRGIAYRNKGDARTAIEDYTRAIELDPEYRDAYNNRGLALSDLGRYAEAVELYTKAIELDPGYWYAYNHRGLALWSLGDRDAAVRDYGKVAQLMGVEPR